MNDAKAIFATITSLTAAVSAWVSALEAALRIGASIAAILAGLAAWSYWRAKKKKLAEDKQDRW